MPVRRATWSSWNYQSFTKTKSSKQQVCLTYWMNRLQPFIPREKDVFVTLNPVQDPKKEHIVAEFEYEHPYYSHDVPLLLPIPFPLSPSLSF